MRLPTTSPQGTETLISQIAGFSDEEIENYLAQDDAFTTATMESWKSVKDELGAYSSIVSQDVEKDGDVVTISTVAQFEKAKADVVLMLDLGTADVHQHDLQRTVFSGSK